MDDQGRIKSYFSGGYMGIIRRSIAKNKEKLRRKKVKLPRVGMHNILLLLIYLKLCNIDIEAKIKELVLWVTKLI